MSRTTESTAKAELTELGPAVALVREGWSQLQLQRPLAAWAFWQRALRLVPDDAAALEAIALLEGATDLPAAARAAYRFQAPAEPSRRVRWDTVLRGRDHEDLYDAAGAFEVLCNQDPGDATAWYNRALCLAWLGRNVESVGAFEQVVRLQAEAAFDSAVAAGVIAEIVRQGAGAETLADDLRYSLIVDWNERDTAKFREQCVGLRAMPAPRDPVTGELQFPGTHAFEWLDLPLASPPGNVDNTKASRLLATAVLTSTTLRISSPDAATLESAQERLAPFLDLGRLPVRREAGPLPLSLLDAAAWTFRLPAGVPPDVESQFTRDAVEHYYEDLWIHQPRHSLGDRSPLEGGRAAVAGDAVARASLTAVVQVREQLGARTRAVVLYQGYPFDRLRRRLGLAVIDATTVDLADLSCASEQELDQIRPDSLDADRLADAYASAAALRGDDRTAGFATALVREGGPALARVVAPELFAVLVRRALNADSPSEALEWLDQARALDEPNRRTYQIWSAEIYARHGNPDAAMTIYESLLAQPSSDPTWLLDAAEDLLQFGYVDHAAPLLTEGLDQAERQGHVQALARARVLSVEVTGPGTAEI